MLQYVYKAVPATPPSWGTVQIRWGPPRLEIAGGGARTSVCGSWTPTPKTCLCLPIFGCCQSLRTVWTHPTLNFMKNTSSSIWDGCRPWKNHVSRLFWYLVEKGLSNSSKMVTGCWKCVSIAKNVQRSRINCLKNCSKFSSLIGLWLLQIPTYVTPVVLYTATGEAPKWLLMIMKIFLTFLLFDHWYIENNNRFEVIKSGHIYNTSVCTRWPGREWLSVCDYFHWSE